MRRRVDATRTKLRFGKGAEVPRRRRPNAAAGLVPLLGRRRTVLECAARQGDDASSIPSSLHGGKRDCAESTEQNQRERCVERVGKGERTAIARIWVGRAAHGSKGEPARSSNAEQLPSRFPSARGLVPRAPSPRPSRPPPIHPQRVAQECSPPRTENEHPTGLDEGLGIVPMQFEIGPRKGSIFRWVFRTFHDGGSLGDAGALPGMDARLRDGTRSRNMSMTWKDALCDCWKQETNGIPSCRCDVDRRIAALE